MALHKGRNSWVFLKSPRQSEIYQCNLMKLKRCHLNLKDVSCQHHLILHYQYSLSIVDVFFIINGCNPKRIYYRTLVSCNIQLTTQKRVVNTDHKCKIITMVGQISQRFKANGVLISFHSIPFASVQYRFVGIRLSICVYGWDIPSSQINYSITYTHDRKQRGTWKIPINTPD